MWIENNTPQRLYREVSLDNLEEYLSGGNVSGGYTFGPPQLFFSDSPDMALGQGNNKGVLLEFDPAGIPIKPYAGKPGLNFTGGEYVANISPASIQSNLISFTIKPGAVGSKANNIRLKRFAFQGLLAQGWSKTNGSDGSIIYRRP